MMNWAEGLDAQQRDAVSSQERHVCLLAGPGTGKTRCLTRRIEYVLTERNVPSTEIVALTFTRAAVGELREKLAQRMEIDPERSPRVSTLHGFALRQLLRNAELVDLPCPLRIADDFEERWVVVEEMKAILGKKRVDDIQQFLADLSADWETLTVDDDTWESDFPERAAFLGAWLEHRRVYGYTLRAEMVYRLKHALERRDFQLEGPIQQLVVDEYQDLNPCDLAVIKIFSERGVPLFVAGDDDQSIYGFRHAHPDGIRQFTEDYAPCNLPIIETCYRCDTEVLRLAQFVAALDPRRTPKVLHARGGAGPGLVGLLCFQGQEAEARGIAALCDWLLQDQGYSCEDILVLLRSDKDGKMSEPIVDALNGRDIAAEQVTDPLAPLGTTSGPGPGRAMLCALRLALNPRDHLAWRTWLEVRKQGIGKKTRAAVYKIAFRDGMTYTDALDRVWENPGLIPRGKGDQLARELEYLRRLVSDISDAVESGVEEVLELAAGLTIDNENERNEVLSLFGRVRAEIGTDDLSELLRALPLSLSTKDEQAESETRPDTIRIMTMHQAKGLTSKAVIVAAAEDEFVPGRAEGDLEIGDARRLLYVSLTRAEHFLFVTYCERRGGKQLYTGRNAGNPVRHLSQFLEHVPLDYRHDGEEYVSSLLQQSGLAPW